MPTAQLDMTDQLRCPQTEVYLTRLATAMKELTRVISLLRPILPIVKQVLNYLDHIPGVDCDLYNLMKPFNFPYLYTLQEDQMICQDTQVDRVLNRFNKVQVVMYMGDKVRNMVKDRLKPRGRDGEEKFDRAFKKKLKLSIMSTTSTMAGEDHHGLVCIRGRRRGGGWSVGQIKAQKHLCLCFV